MLVTLVLLQIRVSNQERWELPNLEINTKFSRQWISQRCPVYVDHDLAERHPDEPAYRITELGRRAVDDDIDLESLDLD